MSRAVARKHPHSHRNRHPILDRRRRQATVTSRPWMSASSLRSSHHTHIPRPAQTTSIIVIAGPPRPPSPLPQSHLPLPRPHPRPQPLSYPPFPRVSSWKLRKRQSSPSSCPRVNIALRIGTMAAAAISALLTAPSTPTPCTTSCASSAKRSSSGARSRFPSSTTEKKSGTPMGRRARWMKGRGRRCVTHSREHGTRSSAMGFWGMRGSARDTVRMVAWRC